MYEVSDSAQQVKIGTSIYIVWRVKRGDSMYLCLVMTQPGHVAQFLAAGSAAIRDGQWLRCHLSRPVAGKAFPELKQVIIRPVELKKGLYVAFTYRYKTRDEVKNLLPDEAIEQLSVWLGSHFLQAELFTTAFDMILTYRVTGSEPTLRRRPASQTTPPDTSHDRTKARLLDPAAPWLHDLGITSAKGEVLAAAQDKWRQINKYLEIIQNLHKEQPLPPDASIADMGSGKGYLTFALYDYLTNVVGLRPTITGIELRSQLVEKCRKTASKAGFDGLHFVAEDIRDFQSEQLDMLIALHACDTATDLALAEGIRSKAKTIVVAPCCHRQIRNDMHTQNELAPILRHGILEERQAEIVTDGIRALLLEANGYSTAVFEFISTEHTAKNVMITAQHNPNQRAEHKTASLQKIDGIKAGFGIKSHYLEGLLG
jgi:SAM-dependent methyltransferase